MAFRLRGNRSPTKPTTYLYYTLNYEHRAFCNGRPRRNYYNEIEDVEKGQAQKRPVVYDHPLRVVMDERIRKKILHAKKAKNV